MPRDRRRADGRARTRGPAWVAPDGAALLLSLGFRPTWLEPERVWRLAAVASLAMADAAETVADLPTGTIRLKWPNDLVVEPPGTGARKLAGVLGETAGLGTRDPRVIVGLGLNADWAAADFPPDLAGTMTSLREADARATDRPDRAGGRLRRTGLQGRVGSLRGGRFDAADLVGAAADDGPGHPHRPTRRHGLDRSRRSAWTRRAAPCSSRTRMGAAGGRPVLVGEVVARPARGPGRERGVTRWPVRHSGE